MGSELIVLLPALLWLLFMGTGASALVITLLMKHFAPPPRIEDHFQPPQKISPPPPPQPDIDYEEVFERELVDAWNRVPSSTQRAVGMLARQIRFTGNRVYLGQQKTGGRELGVHPVECPHPADTVDVRPLRDLSEVPNLLLTEMLLDDSVFEARIASGQSLVQVHQKFEPYFEAEYQAVYKEHVEVVYILLDVSPSMYDEPWRIPVWQSLFVRLVQKAYAAKAPLLLRVFGWQCGPLRVASDPKSFLQVLNHVLSMPRRTGTHITRALMAAIRDFRDREYDSADIMIITDGEDGELNAPVIRKALDDAQIRVHAVMLGVENAGLRDCVDTYQIVEEGELAPKTHPPVRRVRNLKLRS